MKKKKIISNNDKRYYRIHNLHGVYNIVYHIIIRTYYRSERFYLGNRIGSQNFTLDRHTGFLSHCRRRCIDRRLPANRDSNGIYLYIPRYIIYYYVLPTYRTSLIYYRTHYYYYYWILNIVVIVVGKCLTYRAIQKSTVGPSDKWFSPDGPRNNNCNAKCIRSASLNNNDTYAFNQLYQNIIYILFVWAARRCASLAYNTTMSVNYIYFCYHLSVGTYTINNCLSWTQ